MSELVQQLCSGRSVASWPLERLAAKLSAWFTGSWSVTVEELQRCGGPGSDAERMQEAGHNAEVGRIHHDVTEKLWVRRKPSISVNQYGHMVWFTFALRICAIYSVCFIVEVFLYSPRYTNMMGM